MRFAVVVCYGRSKPLPYQNLFVSVIDVRYIFSLPLEGKVPRNEADEVLQTVFADERRISAFSSGRRWQTCLRSRFMTACGHHG